MITIQLLYCQSAYKQLFYIIYLAWNFMMNEIRFLLFSFMKSPNTVIRSRGAYIKT